MSEAASNKRRFQRVRISPDVSVLQIIAQVGKTGQNETMVVNAIDLSKAGVSFRSSKAMPEGTKCVALINRKTDTLRIIGKVTNCRQAEGGGFIIGLRFTGYSRLPNQKPTVPLTEDAVINQLMIDP